jgi:hypothetical protein
MIVFKSSYRSAVPDGSSEPLFSSLKSVPVATPLRLRYRYKAIGGLVHIRASTVRVHVNSTAAKIPGELPGALRVAVSARGASLEVLPGSPLREDVLEAILWFASMIADRARTSRFRGRPGRRVTRAVSAHLTDDEAVRPAGLDLAGRGSGAR